MTQLSDRARRLLELRVRLLEAADLCRTEIERETNARLMYLVDCSIREELEPQIKQLRKEIAAQERRPKKPRRSKPDYFIKTRPSA